MNIPFYVTCMYTGREPIRERDSLEHFVAEYWKDAKPAEAFFASLDAMEEQHLSSSERIALFQRAISDPWDVLSIQEVDVQTYFEKFPGDLDVLKQRYDDADGIAENTDTYLLFVIIAPYIDSALTAEHHAQWDLTVESVYDRFEQGEGTHIPYQLEQYLDTSKRKDVATHHLMDTTATGGAFKTPEQKRVLAIIDTTFASIATAERVSGEHVSIEELFDAIQAQDQETQVIALHHIIAESQRRLLFREVYGRTATTPRMQKRVRSYPHIAQLPHVHSILFDSYQPREGYEQSDEKFEEDVNEPAFIADVGVAQPDERAYHRCIREAIRRLAEVDFSHSQTVDMLCEFWEKNTDPMFIHPLAHTLSSLDAPRAAGNLMESLHDNERHAVAISALLYRIELGELGVGDEHSVEYLGIRYDLDGERAKSADTVRRITSNGEMGVFDEHGTLIGYFSLGDLADPVLRRRAEIFEITRQLLYVDDSTDQDGTMKKKFFEKYKEFCDTIFGRDGVRASDVSLREQAWAFQFAQEHPDAWDAVTPLKQEYQRRFVRLFIACEQDAGIAQRLVDFLNDASIQKDVKEQLLDMYSDVTDEFNHIEERVAAFFKEGIQELDLDNKKVTSHIAKRAYQKLNQVFDMYEGNGKNTDIKAILDAVSKEVVIFTSIFESVFQQQGKVDFESVRGLDYEILSGPKLNEEQRKEMISIVTANWEDRGVVGKKIVKSFTTIVADSSYIWHLLKKDGKIIAFISLSPWLDAAGKKQEGHSSVGAFNVHPQYRGSTVGQAMEVVGLQMEATRTMLHATVSPTLDVGNDYIEKRGFVISGTLPKYAGSDETFFSIERPKDGSLLYETKNTHAYKRGMIMEQYDHLFKDDDVESHFQKNENPIVARFDTTREQERLLSTVDAATQYGYVATRYFIDSQDRSVRWYVFEKRKEEDIATEGV